MTTTSGFIELAKELRLKKVLQMVAAGLLVERPEDHIGYIIEKLRESSTLDESEYTLDRFIPEELRPKKKSTLGGDVDFFFDFESGFMADDLSEEQVEYAMNMFNNGIVRRCFRGWKRFLIEKRIIVAEEKRLARRADALLRKTTLRHFYKTWCAWRTIREKRRRQAEELISRVAEKVRQGIVFKAWRSDTLEARKTKEYFAKMEKGEFEDEESWGEATDAEDNVSVLPLRAAVNIFSHVTLLDMVRCEVVCRTWRMIVSNGQLWTKVNMSSLNSKFENGCSDGMVNSVMNKCRPFLVHLNLRGSKKLSIESYISISFCQNLQDLNLSQCVFDEEMLSTVLDGCRMLLYLNVSSTKINDNCLRSLSNSCQVLQYLNLSFCRAFTDKGLQYLATGKCASKLRHLDLSGCNQVTVEGFQAVGDGCYNLHSLFLNNLLEVRNQDAKRLISNGKKFRTLSISGSPFLGDQVMTHISGMNYLTWLRIEGNDRISDTSIKTITKNCSELQQIYLIDCPRITDASLRGMSLLKSLSVLNLADCIRVSDAGLRAVLEGPSGVKLRELNMANCVRVSDVSLQRIAQRSQALAYATFAYCSHITDAGLELLGSMPNLTAVDLTGCCIQDAGLETIGKNPRLREVYVGECQDISDLGVQKLVNQLKKLEVLDVSQCKNLTDNAVKILAFCCRFLVKLNLAGCFQISDTSIQYLSGGCHYLHELDLSGCVDLNDKMVKFLKKGCKRLDRLHLRYCKNISKETVRRLQKDMSVVIHSTDDPSVEFTYY